METKKTKTKKEFPNYCYGQEYYLNMSFMIISIKNMLKSIYLVRQAFKD